MIVGTGRMRPKSPLLPASNRTIIRETKQIIYKNINQWWNNYLKCQKKSSKGYSTFLVSPQMFHSIHMTAVPNAKTRKMYLPRQKSLFSYYSKKTASSFHFQPLWKVEILHIQCKKKVRLSFPCQEWQKGCCLKTQCVF